MLRGARYDPSLVQTHVPLDSLGHYRAGAVSALQMGSVAKRIHGLFSVCIFPLLEKRIQIFSAVEIPAPHDVS